VLKHFVETLEEAPMEFRGAYVAQTAGGFRLHPTIIEDIAAHEARMAVETARLEQARALLRKLTVEATVNKALAKHPVSPGLREGVVALFMKEMPVGTREEGDAVVAFVETPYGPVSVESALEGWLGTEEGAAYLEKATPLPGDGPLAQQIRALRTVH
jgi:hypothetical protein